MRYIFEQKKDLLNKKVKTYSYGERKKVFIIIADILKPKLLIMDEVSNGLDYETMIMLKAKIKLWAESSMIVLTGHQFEFYKDIVERVFVINGHKIKCIKKEDNLTFFLFCNYNMLGKFKTDLKIYTHTYEEMEEWGENVDELLSQEANVVEEITSKNSVQQLVDNPLRYDYDNLVNSYTYIKDANIIVGLLENSTLIFLIYIFIIFGISIFLYMLQKRKGGWR